MFKEVEDAILSSAKYMYEMFITFTWNQKVLQSLSWTSLQLQALFLSKQNPFARRFKTQLFPVSFCTAILLAVSYTCVDICWWKLKLSI